MNANNSHGSLSVEGDSGNDVGDGDCALQNLGLGAITIGDSKVSSYWKGRLVDLIKEYKSVFSHHHLDCGEARCFCHRIRLTDNRPFRLP